MKECDRPGDRTMLSPRIHEQNFVMVAGWDRYTFRVINCIKQGVSAAAIKSWGR